MRTLVLTALLVVACQPSEEAPDEDVVPQTFEAWKASHPCPSDARLDVSDPYGMSTVANCVLPDGTKHGPFAVFSPDGAQSTGGIRNHGTQEVSTSYIDGRRFKRETLRPDGKTEITFYEGKKRTVVVD